MAYERLADVQGANVAPSLGDRAAAIANYRRSLAIRRQLAIDHPSLMHRADLLLAESNLVETLLSSGDVAGAQALGADMIRLADEVDADPAVDLTQRRAVGAAFVNQGWMEWSAGHAESGLESLVRARDVYRRIANDYPDDPRVRRDLALVAGRLGEVHAKGTGRLEEAIRYYRETVAALDPLVRDDPENGEVARMNVYARATIGDLYNLLARPREALLEVEPALPVFYRMRAADPADQIAPFALAAALNIVGESRLQLREFEVARRTFAEAASLTDPKVAATVPDLQLLEGIARAGLARANAGIAGAAASDIERDTARQQADHEGHRALDLLEPLATAPQIGKDARRQIEATRAALAWSG
jgi:tetratricopeptide (TPR) repeat protein